MTAIVDSKKANSEPVVSGPVPVFGLPSPADFPDSDIVVFDGKCQFCTRQVKNLFRWDGKNRLAFVSLHDPWVSQTFPELTHDRLMEEMVVVTRSGNRFGGAEAFRYLTTRLPKLWILAPVMYLPFMLPVWKWCYRQVARRRYLWNRKHGGSECENDSCSVHFD